MDDLTNDTVVVVSRTLEMKPIILSVLNAAGRLSDPLIMMNILVSAMVVCQSNLSRCYHLTQYALCQVKKLHHTWYMGTWRSQTLWRTQFFASVAMSGASYDHKCWGCRDCGVYLHTRLAQLQPMPHIGIHDDKLCQKSWKRGNSTLLHSKSTHLECMPSFC